MNGRRFPPPWSVEDWTPALSCATRTDWRLPRANTLADKQGRRCQGRLDYGTCNCGIPATVRAIVLTPVLVFTRTFGVAVHNPMALFPPAVIAATFYHAARVKFSVLARS